MGCLAGSSYGHDLGVQRMICDRRPYSTLARCQWHTGPPQFNTDRPLRGIIPARVKGMAAADSQHAAHRTGDRPVFPDRLDEVLTARGHKPAVSAQKWAERHLIQADAADKESRRNADDEPRGTAKRTPGAWRFNCGGAWGFVSGHWSGMNKGFAGTRHLQEAGLWLRVSQQVCSVGCDGPDDV